MVALLPGATKNYLVEFGQVDIDLRLVAERASGFLSVC